MPEIRKFVAAVVAQAGYPMGLGGENPWNEALNEVAGRQGFTIADLTPDDLRDNPYLKPVAAAPEVDHLAEAKGWIKSSMSDMWVRGSQIVSARVRIGSQGGRQAYIVSLTLTDGSNGDMSRHDTREQASAALDALIHSLCGNKET